MWICKIMGWLWLGMAVCALYNTLSFDSPPVHYVGALVASQVWFGVDIIIVRLQR